MSSHVVTWKKIAEKANEMYPKTLRPPIEQRGVAKGPVEYIAAAVVKKGKGMSSYSPQKERQ